MTAQIKQFQPNVYGDAPKEQKKRAHTLVIIVDNEPGVLARVVGLFSGRGYNIESLHVTPTNRERTLSEIRVVSIATEAAIEQIKLQVERLIPVHSVYDSTMED